MKKDKKLNTLNFNYLIILSLLYSYSCRSAEQDNILSGSGLAPVKINLLGSEYANSDKPAQVASINQKGLAIDNNPQHYSALISPSSFISAELTANRSLSPAASSKNLNTVATVAGDQFGVGMKFRVIAYRKDNGSYQTYQDYIVGQQAAPLMLDSGTTYNIVVYSYGSTTLPVINSSEQSNISSANIDYDNDNKDLMYQKISDFTPDGNSTNTLNITLRHKIAQITTIVNSGSLGNITNITGGLLTPLYSNGVVSLSSGNISGRTTSSTGAVLNFSGFNTTTSTSTPVFVNADTGGNAPGGFSAAITIAGITKTVNLPNSFKITPENKSNLTINLRKCGAYIGSNTNPANYKEFMYQNLGATAGVDPFSAEAGNHGAKYQWGANTNGAGRYISQANDQSNSGKVSGWISTPKPAGSWSDGSKTGNDPCPSGYRVPTSAQWQTVINNNNVERIGSWDNNGNNYTTALYFRNPSNIRTLMLPAAGSRDTADGTLDYRGSNGIYWTSSGATSKASSLHFHSGSVELSSYARSDGFSVRCVAE